MKIIIDEHTRINVYSNHYALCKRIKIKKTSKWQEYKWFNSLEYCITYLVQKSFSDKKTTLHMADFLEEYKKTQNKLKKLIETKIK